MDTKGHTGIFPFDVLPIASENLYETDDPSDGSNKNYKWEPAHIEAGDWRLGWTDGRLGQPAQHHKDLIAAEAKLAVAKFASDLREKIVEKKSQLAKNSEQALQLSLRLRQIRGVFEELRARRFRSPMDFSWLLGLVMLVAAFAVWSADIPLTLSLVSKGFNIKTQTSVPGVTEPVEVSGLLLYPGYVIKALWEPLLLAIGLTLSPMALKLVLEDFFFKEGDDRKLLSRKNLLYLLIVILMIASLLILGMFRSGVSQNSLEEKARADVEMVREQWKLPDENGASGTASTPPTGTPSGPSSSNSAALSAFNVLTTRTFILLSLMLAISGAILFSSGWSRMSKARLFNRLSNSVMDAESEYAKKKAEVTEHEAWIAEAEKLTAAKESEFQQAYTGQRNSAYEHGHERGRRVTETRFAGEGMYDRCKRVVFSRQAKQSQGI